MVAIYMLGLLAVFLSIVIGFWALVKEDDDLHRILLTDLAEILALALIALVATDLAEALILPGLVVGISELMAISEVFLVREGLTRQPERTLHIEVMDSAPALLSLALVGYGVLLAGFSGGAVAGIGVIFYFICKGHDERFAIFEALSGYAWVMWIVAFFIFVLVPQYWFFGVLIAGSAILLKVTGKMSLVGTMRGGSNV
jgi:energy-converting hydrogenase A subunit G